MQPKHRALLDSPDFHRLVARRWKMSLLLTTLLFILYYGFIVLVAVDRGFLSQRISGATTLGIPFGAGVILGAWALTAAYVRWANRHYDPAVANLRRRLHED